MPKQITATEEIKLLFEEIVSIKNLEYRKILQAKLQETTLRDTRLNELIDFDDPEDLKPESGIVGIGNRDCWFNDQHLFWKIVKAPLTGVNISRQDLVNFAINQRLHLDYLLCVKRYYGDNQGHLSLGGMSLASQHWRVLCTANTFGFIRLWSEAMKAHTVNFNDDQHSEEFDNVFPSAFTEELKSTQKLIKFSEDILLEGEFDKNDNLTHTGYKLFLYFIKLDKK